WDPRFPSLVGYASRRRWPSRGKGAAASKGPSLKGERRDAVVELLERCNLLPPASATGNFRGSGHIRRARRARHPAVPRKSGLVYAAAQHELESDFAPHYHVYDILLEGR